MPLDHTDLKEMKKSGDVEGLLCALDTGDIKEVRDAVCILGELRYRKAVRPLIGLLEKDDVQIRANSAWALGEIGDVRAVLPLIGLLNDPSENVRVYAAWALGRIGDKRAISALNAAVKGGSLELRKHAKEAIARIDTNKHNTQDGGNYSDIGNEIFTSGSIDIPLVTLNAPLDVLVCNYVSRVEGESKKGRLKFSEDIAIKDTTSTGEKNRRRIVLGLKNDFNGSVSIDIIFRYRDSNRRISSVWLQMASAGEYSIQDRSDNLQDSLQDNLQDRDYDWDSEELIEEAEDRSRRDIKRSKIKSRREQSVEPEDDISEYQDTDELEDEIEIREQLSRDRRSRDRHIQNNHAVKTKIKSSKQEIHKEKSTNEIPLKPKLKTNEDLPAKESYKEVKSQVLPQLSSERAVEENQISIQIEKTGVDSAVRLLSDIGMSGMAEAASTVTQLGGQEAEPLQSRLRTLPTDQIPDELVNLGDHIVSIEVKLHGKGQDGEMEGKMQLYFSKNVALEIANELLCNTPDIAIKEFTEDIVSTLKETANIFGGQYVSAISEYVEVPILLETPIFKIGTSLQLAESLMKDIAGKIEFALATDLNFGNNKTGRLIMLLDPKSYEIIIAKLF